jgi:RNA polymerase sigma-70 factor (ECF subfamily)
MNSTSESLLIRLRQPGDQKAWSEFVRLYAPLIFRWARKTGIQVQDSRDIVQDVLAIVFQKLPEFQYEPSMSFRGWLRTITLNKHREYCRRAGKVVSANQSALLSLAVANAESTWDLNYRQALVDQALELIRHEFQTPTWEAVREFSTTDGKAAVIAKKHGVSVWTIYSAKSRMMSRLREIVNELMD